MTTAPAHPGQHAGRTARPVGTLLGLRGRAHHETTVVTTDDGARLHVEIDGPPDAPLTVLLCHGYALSCQSWYFQRAELSRHTRVVSWDHRGHGRSTRAPDRRTTIDQLGRDLFTVLERVAPTGPVVLAGHSMGGMVVMTLAEQHPELFGDRVAGVALLATSAGPVNTSLGLPLPAGTAVNRTALQLIPVIERLRAIPGGTRAVRELTLVLARRCSFASPVPASLVAFLSEMIHGTPIEVLAELLPQFVTLDKFRALPVLRGVATLVVAAANDVVTAPAYSAAIAKAVPGAELVVVPAAGHAVILEHPERVNACLRRLLARVGQTEWPDRVRPVG